MPLNKPNQEPHRTPRAAAFKLQHADTLALMMLISRSLCGRGSDCDTADEVKVGVITRVQVE